MQNRANSAMSVALAGSRSQPHAVPMIPTPFATQMQTPDRTLQLSPQSPLGGPNATLSPMAVSPAIASPAQAAMLRMHYVDPHELVCQWQLGPVPGFKCGAALATADDLFQHLCDAHVGRKSNGTLCLTCQWDGCGATAAKRDHMTSHIRVHVPLRPYICKLCARPFKRSYDLKKHVTKIHEGLTVVSHSLGGVKGPQSAAAALTVATPASPSPRSPSVVHPGALHQLTALGGHHHSHPRALSAQPLSPKAHPWSADAPTSRAAAVAWPMLSPPLSSASLPSPTHLTPSPTVAPGLLPPRGSRSSITTMGHSRSLSESHTLRLLQGLSGGPSPMSASPVTPLLPYDAIRTGRGSNGVIWGPPARARAHYPSVSDGCIDVTALAQRPRSHQRSRSHLSGMVPASNAVVFERLRRTSVCAKRAGVPARPHNELALNRFMFEQRQQLQVPSTDASVCPVQWDSGTQSPNPPAPPVSSGEKFLFDPLLDVSRGLEVHSGPAAPTSSPLAVSTAAPLTDAMAVSQSPSSSVPTTACETAAAMSVGEFDSLVRELVEMDQTSSSE